MQISIEAELRRGLRIISEIPDIPLCRIEGYNGIGKTSAIKLLQLCCGEQPFEGHDSAWRTFREQLISARVRVSNLHGSEDIEWELSTKKWPITPELPGADFATVRIGGRPARIGDLRDLLEVHHVRADETLVDMLIQYSESSRNTINGWLASHGISRRESVDQELKSIQDAVLACSPSQLPLDVQAAADSHEMAQVARENAQKLRTRVELLESAVQVLEKIEQVRGRGSEMDAKLAHLKEQIEDLASRKGELDTKITQASERQQLDTQSEKEFSLAQKQFLRQEKNFQEAQGKLEEECSRAFIGSDREAIEQARRSTGKKLSELVALQPQVHATPLLIELLIELIRPLERAGADELGDKFVVDGDQDRAGYTVSGLKEALSLRLSELEGQSPGEEAEQLASNIEMARSKLNSISEIETLLSKNEEAERNRERAKQRLRAAAAGLPPTTAKTLNELLTERNRLDEEATAAQLQHTRLHQARELLGGGQTEDALAVELVQLSATTGVEASRVRGRLEEEARELDDLTRRYNLASQQAASTRRVADERIAQLAQVVTDLSTQAKLSWLRKAIPALGELSSVSLKDQAQVLTDVLHAVESARNRLASTVGAVQGISGALGNVVNLLRSGDAATGTWNDPVRAWLSEEVRRWFDNEQVRQALFGGGKDVRLDPLAMTVSWTDANGAAFTRPLTAFSSGQQAFAFTRARVAQLDRETHGAANRLIALDEFGSVIDSEKMSHLASFLDQRREQRPHDQVVVILPLREEFLHSATSQSAPRHRESLRGSGYFAEPLRP